MDQSRKVRPNPKIYCNFSAGGAITFDPIAAEFMNEGGVIWMLLHEEAHLILPQKRSELIFPKLLLKCIITFFLVGMISLLTLDLIHFRGNSFYPPVLDFVLFLVVFLLCVYIERNLFRDQYVVPFYNDEYRCDEYALMGLCIARPHLIAWQEVYSALESFKKCKERRGKLTLFEEYKRKITSYPHPSHGQRAYYLKTIYEKYRSLKDLL